jgi:hypothetical protein
VTKLYDRRCVVLVGRPATKDEYELKTPTAVRIEGLRVDFKIIRTDKPPPNPAEISVYNLSRETRKSLEGKGMRVVLHAGYPGTEAQIFSGDVRVATHTKVGPDWVTKIEAGDGERAFNFAHLSESFGPGTPVKDVVKRAVQALATDPGNAMEKMQKLVGEFSSGHVVHSRAATELTRLLPAGWTWSIQDGRIEILPPGETLNEPAPLISADSGLIGSPQMNQNAQGLVGNPAMCSPTEKGKPALLKVKSLLLPRLRPGQRFQLESESYKGVYRVKNLTHTGSTWGGDWYTEVEALPP